MLRIILRWFGHQGWIRFGLRNRLVRLVHHPKSRRGNYSFSVPFYGFTYSGKLDNLIDFEVYFFGAYAKPELDLFEDILGDRDEAVVWDIGSNVGHHSLFLAGLAKQVVAFEPYLPVAEYFEQLMKENMIDHVQLIKVGLSDRAHSLPFHCPPANNKGTGFFSINDVMDSEKEGNSTLSLELIPGDDFAAEAGLKRLDLVKIDVEGHEPQVLKGMDKTLRKYRPAIFLEWSCATNENFSYSELISSLPDEYRVDQFLDRVPFAFFFDHKKYRLEMVTSKPVEGNLLLLPLEWALPQQ